MPSVKETIEEIRDQECLEERRQRAEEEAKQKALRERFHNEFPQARRQQAVLLEELRNLGVIPIIEDLTGPIFPLRGRVGNEYLVREPTPEELERSRKWPRPRRIMDPPEYAEIVDFPVMNEDGSASRNLVITVMHFRFIGIPSISGGDGWALEVAKVVYTEDKNLTISGAEVIFSGQIPEDEAGTRTEVVTKALAWALVHPKSISGRDSLGYTLERVGT